MPALPTLRQLGYLVELSQRLNFHAAAEAQFVTQSTLSAGIKELETLLGVQLVERDKRHVRLTAVGEDVAARGRELLAAATDLTEAARSASTSCSNTTNSSPPSRATTSAARRHSRNRTLISRSRTSPASCPNVSLMTLKRSRSMNSTASLRL